MSPEERDGKWWVGESGPFNTNAEAWRWLDRQENQPVSKAEDIADWIARKQ